MPTDFFLPMKASATRSHTTLVAMVTPDAEMQRYLPQILIPNHDRTSKAEYTHYAQLGQPILLEELHRVGGHWLDVRHTHAVETLCQRPTRRRMSNRLAA